MDPCVYVLDRVCLDLPTQPRFCQPFDDACQRAAASTGSRSAQRSSPFQWRRWRSASLQLVLSFDNSSRCDGVPCTFGVHGNVLRTIGSRAIVPQANPMRFPVAWVRRMEEARSKQEAAATTPPREYVGGVALLSNYPLDSIGYRGMERNVAHQLYDALLTEVRAVRKHVDKPGSRGGSGRSGISGRSGGGSSGGGGGSSGSGSRSSSGSSLGGSGSSLGGSLGGSGSGGSGGGSGSSSSGSSGSDSSSGSGGSSSSSSSSSSLLVVGAAPVEPNGPNTSLVAHLRRTFLSSRGAQYRRRVAGCYDRLLLCVEL
jgi:hypothetical protein